VDKTTGVLTALIIAPMAIVVSIALLRGYRFDIHFDRDNAEDGGIFHRRRKQDPPDNTKGDG
jgi:hypothetical protein